MNGVAEANDVTYSTYTEAGLVSSTLCVVTSACSPES